MLDTAETTWPGDGKPSPGFFPRLPFQGNEMIGKLLSTLVVLAIGAAAMWYALAHHIVTTDDGRLFLPKAELGFTDTFVDITDWSAADFNDNRAVTQALIDNDHADLVVKSAADSAIDKIKDFFTGDDENKPDDENK